MSVESLFCYLKILSAKTLCCFLFFYEFSNKDLQKVLNCKLHNSK